MKPPLSEEMNNACAPLAWIGRVISLEAEVAALRAENIRLICHLHAIDELLNAALPLANEEAPCSQSA